MAVLQTALNQETTGVDQIVWEGLKATPVP